MTQKHFSAHLLETRLDIPTAHSEFFEHFGHCGALTTFVGVVRPDREGQTVDYLELDWYPGLSERSLNQVLATASGRFDLAGLRIFHRCGKVVAGEAIVFVGAAGSHRRETIEAVDYTMDRLKSDIALWKREIGPQLNHWVEPTQKDTADLGRWGVA